MDVNKAIPPLCTKCCGLYGSPGNKNMCSKCYKEYLKADVITKNEAKALNVEKTFDSKCIQHLVPILFPVKRHQTLLRRPSVKNRCKNCNKKIRIDRFQMSMWGYVLWGTPISERTFLYFRFQES
ncbi:hypothetical protein Pint_17277 [Pistacia integerrima]|uniref:Uncharacterized protein n=1 Tax=Pistacia integerrima TaxID=434235 RepID=A0ACC0YX11_9ROSI|nr:hypothetical protein Pint_17277 [Pistacia integerrima]